VRPTRLIYVENDPALLGVMSTLLGRLPALEVLLTTTDPLVALASTLVEDADVALIDLALGRDTLDGMDLGVALRNRNPHIGIVIHSQHPMRKISGQLTDGERIGWSFLAKTGTLKPTELCDLLISTAAGMSHNRLLETDVASGAVGETALAHLTPRQRTIMGLASLGMSAPEIAQQIGLTPESVRKDLSKAYRSLVPAAEGRTDVRTQAVMAYVNLIQARDESLE